MARRSIDFPELPDYNKLVHDAFPTPPRLPDNIIPEMLKKYCWPDPFADNWHKKSAYAHAVLVWDWNEDKTKVDITLYYCSPHRDMPDVVESHLLTATISETNVEKYYRISIKIGRRNISWLVEKAYLDTGLYNESSPGPQSITKEAARATRDKIVADYHDFLLSLREQEDFIKEVAELAKKCSHRKKPADVAEIIPSIEQLGHEIWTHIDHIGRGDKMELYEKRIPKEPVWYFAYGIDISERCMQELIGDWYLRQPAILHGYKLVFSVQEPDNPHAGSLNLEHDAKGVVHGVVYLITTEQKEKLISSREPNIYKLGGCRTDWVVWKRHEIMEGVYLLDNTWLSDTFAFFGRHECVAPGLKPYRATVEQLLIAGDDVFPSDYIKYLNKVKTFD